MKKNMNHYLGHSNQISGVEKFRLCGGKGDGMRLYNVRNGTGLEFTVSADRCSDISHLTYKGININYFSPCGYVSPYYYDASAFGFLKSFTCGFLTTCGLKSIGAPSIENNVSYPLHGNISHVPADHIYYTEDDTSIEIHSIMRDASIFNSKLILERTIRCSKNDNSLIVSDTVTNQGESPEPIMLLYHINLGYPMLDENTRLEISSSDVLPRDEHAATAISEWDKMLPPQSGIKEQCYYHLFKSDIASVKVYNPEINCRMSLVFNTDTLPYLTEWKMMGIQDYVLGLEPCTNTLEGRKSLGENKSLSLLAPGESKSYGFKATFEDYFD